MQKVTFKKVIEAGFTDEQGRFFVISFDTEDGTRQDLTIVFETRTPRVFISDKYAE